MLTAIPTFSRGPRAPPSPRAFTTGPSTTGCSPTPSLALGEAYTNGTLTVKDADLYDFLDLFGRNMELSGLSHLKGTTGWINWLLRRLQQWNTAGWARFNAEEQMAKLEKAITPTLRKFAGDGQHLDVVRENCRKTVSEFIEDWLLREGQWGDGLFRVVKVYFPGEVEPVIVEDDPERRDGN